MPQLDKYIFFNQILYLTFFFLLIYMYIRGTVVPKLSTLLKYRRKKTELFNIQLEGYLKILSFSKSFFNKSGKTYLNYVLSKVSEINNYYNKESSEKIINNYEQVLNTILKNNKVSSFIIRNKKEKKRLNIV